jgi:ribonuclease J
MTVYEYGDDAIVVDAGLAFPRDEHLGVDLILRTSRYLRDRGRPVRAVILTHAHEDHVGSLPYLLREVPVDEVWATRLTLGSSSRSSTSTGSCAPPSCASSIPRRARSSSAGSGGVRPDGALRPDAVAVVLETEAGRVLHTGDWKLDHTPVDGLRTDVGRLAEIGNRGVDLLLGDSTNAERPGVTGSERLVGEAFRQIIPQRTGRVLVASFASNVHRMQQATDVAVEVGRKVCVVGRSMRKNLNIARNLGYIDMPEDVLIRPSSSASTSPARC